MTRLLASLTSGRGRLLLGCDYNPEQTDDRPWRDVVSEDLELMIEMGVDLVAINVFGWARLETSAGVYDFAELDELMDRLQDAGIRVNLGTGTSSAPPWWSLAHPDSLPVDRDGVRAWPGSRQAWCPSNPDFRRDSVALVERMAERYSAHPALAVWHVSNELGCHNAHCYCDVSAAAFRGWLQRRYETIAALNVAWGTSVWSQRYNDFDEVLPPRRTLAAANPAQQLDFARFSSDELLLQYEAEAAVLRRHGSTPVTTNFMVTTHIRNQDYWQWAPAMDVVANDHYLDNRLADPTAELSFCADLTRGLAGGEPWLLMETSTGAVSWQPVNRAKAPGQLLRNALTHVARGSDAVCFFQWRQGRRGAERHHSAIVPHAGTDSSIWRESLELSRVLGALAPVAGSRVHADVAIVYSWQSWWGSASDTRPTSLVEYPAEVAALHAAFRRAGVTVDVVAPSADLSGYAIVAVPHLAVVSDADAANIAAVPARGGVLVATFGSGLADENDAVRLGGYPGAFREVLGVRSDEILPLLADETVALASGGSASLWTERIELLGAVAIDSYAGGAAGGVLAGGPAVTRNAVADGSAWYLSTRLDEPSTDRVITTILGEAGIRTSVHPGDALEIVERRSDTEHFVFAINHSAADLTISASGHELITDTPVTADIRIPAGAVRVIRQQRN